MLCFEVIKKRHQLSVGLRMKWKSSRVIHIMLPEGYMQFGRNTLYKDIRR